MLHRPVNHTGAFTVLKLRYLPRAPLRHRLRQRDLIHTPYIGHSHLFSSIGNTSTAL